MFDLKFHPYVLDKMPVGTAFRDSDHVITKTEEGWKCEECYPETATLQDSSSAYMMSFFQECTLEKFAGAEIDPDNLDPRLLAFLPAGTKVADNDTLSDNRLCWHKTKTGRWVWAENQEQVEASANAGMGIKDLGGHDHLRPFRLLSVGTDDAPESDGAPTEPVRLAVAEATSLRDIVYDNGGRKWIYTSEGGYRLALGGGVLGQLRERLPAANAPYFTEDPRAESAPETEPEIEFTAEEASSRKDTVFKDSDGDAWFFDFGLWQWRAMGSGWAFAKEELDSLFSPYTKVGPLSELVWVWTAEEANNLKKEALEDKDGDIWIYDVSSERWKCSAEDEPDSSELKKAYQPYRIKSDSRGRAAAPEAIFLGYDEPFQLAGGTEEVTLEGSAKEEVEILNRIARSLESIDRKLGDK